MLLLSLLPPPPPLGGVIVSSSRYNKYPANPSVAGDYVASSIQSFLVPESIEDSFWRKIINDEYSNLPSYPVPLPRGSGEGLSF
ncbi:MAG: hypothetical protein KKH60_09845, partial [Proteobacteria bacterium]|nr:hypothetical protein [Pseudomonadota bacterium]